MSTMNDIKDMKENAAEDYEALKDLVAEFRSTNPDAAAINVKKMYDAVTPGEVTPDVLRSA